MDISFIYMWKEAKSNSEMGYSFHIRKQKKTEFSGSFSKRPRHENDVLSVKKKFRNCIGFASLRFVIG